MARDGRRYNEREIGALIQRATELHEQAQGSSENGLSLGEIEHIAKELGLPAEFMQAAAQELEHRPAERRGFSLFGGPFKVQDARIIDAGFDDEDWAEVVMEIRRQTGHAGTASEVGSAREWTHFMGEGANGVNLQKEFVSMRPSGGRTVVDVSHHFGAAGLLYFVVGAASLAFAALLTTVDPLPQLVGGLIGTGIFASLMGIVRLGVSRHSRKQQERLRHFLGTVQEMLLAKKEAAGSGAVVPAASEVPSPVLDLDNDGYEPEAEAQRQDQRGTSSLR